MTLAQGLIMDTLGESLPIALLLFCCVPPSLWRMAVPFPGAPTKLLTVEPAGIMGFCSETRILAQAAKDGKVPAHEVRCHPGVQFFPCRKGKGVFSQLQTIEVKVA